MIQKVSKQELSVCAELIRESFLTVADQFGFTVENAPDFTAFATTEEKLIRQMEEEKRPMYAYVDNGRIIGFYSLLLLEDNAIELNNLCVSPACRHNGIAKSLLLHAYEVAKNLGCTKMNIGIVEENQVLRRWYEANGFVHTGTEKFDFFPFTCGYMERDL